MTNLFPRDSGQSCRDELESGELSNVTIIDPLRDGSAESYELLESNELIEILSAIPLSGEGSGDQGSNNDGQLLGSDELS